MSDSTFNFISDEGDGIKVYVEHGDFGEETYEFISGIANDAWFGEVDPEDPEYHKKMNPTLRYWKKHKRPKQPAVTMHRRAFRFTPPKEGCLLGPEPQYETHGEGRWAHQVRKRHPACACQDCDPHRVDWTSNRNFWEKVTGPIKVNV